jgi:hypothetical protein
MRAPPWARSIYPLLMDSFTIKVNSAYAILVVQSIILTEPSHTFTPIKNYFYFSALSYLDSRYPSMLNQHIDYRYSKQNYQYVKFSPYQSTVALNFVDVPSFFNFTK